MDLIAIPIAFSLIGIGIWGWIVAAYRLRKKQSILPLDRTCTPIGLLDLLLIFGFWIVTQVLVLVCLMVVAGPKVLAEPDMLMAQHGVELMYFSGFGQVLVTVAGVLYLVIRYSGTGSFGVRWAGLWRQIKIGIVAFAMMFPIVLALQWLLSYLVPYEHPVMEVLAKNPSWIAIGGVWFAAVVSAPLAEEFFFRGVLHNWFERLSMGRASDFLLYVGGRTPENSKLDQARPTTSPVNPMTAGIAADDSPDQASVSMPPADQAVDNPFQALHAPPTDKPLAENRSNIVPAYWPILVSSLLFAGIHIGQGLAPVPLFVLSLGLGYVFRQTGSLIACWTIHFLLNFYSMAIFTLAILTGETL